jgi:hypothetical protein
LKGQSRLPRDTGNLGQSILPRDTGNLGQSRLPRDTGNLGQSILPRDTGNIGQHTKLKKYEQHRPTKNPEVNPWPRDHMNSILALYITRTGHT